VSESTEQRSYHHGDLREALVEQAIASLNAVGVEHLSLRAVAAAVGVSPSAAYHHFADKDSLIDAVKDRGFEQLDSYIEKSISSERAHASDTVMARRIMTTGAIAYINFAVDYPHWFSIMFSGAKDSSRTPHMESSLAHLRDLFMSTRGISAEDEELTEEVLMASIHGIAALVADGRMDRARVPAAIEVLTKLLIGPPLTDPREIS
jgi:AcrR family transcriptional regulator